jgi:MoaA/NifB/PqqE/SkfB family radical SAM enzyme
MLKKIGKLPKVIKHPRRYYNLFLQNTQRKKYPEKPKYLPSYLQIEITTACSMECPRCERSIMPRKILGKHVPLNYFKKLAPILPNVNFITLGAGLGEPLLNPEFWPIHNYLKSFGVKVHYTTNSLFLTKANIEKTFKYKTDSMDISLDSLNKKVYEKIRPIPKNSFELVLKHIEDICRRKKQLGSKTPTIALGFTAQKENVEEMPDIVDYAKKVGIDNIWFTAVTAHNKGTVKSSLFNLDKQKLRQIFNETAKRAKRANIPIRLPNIYGINTKKQPCPFIWEMMMMFSNGDVCCCPHFRTPRKHFFFIENGKLVKKNTFMPSVILGNINKERIDKIWSNKSYTRLRYENKRNLNEACNKCYFRYNIH